MNSITGTTALQAWQCRIVGTLEAAQPPAQLAARLYLAKVFFPCPTSAQSRCSSMCSGAACC